MCVYLAFVSHQQVMCEAQRFERVEVLKNRKINYNRHLLSQYILTVGFPFSVGVAKTGTTVALNTILVLTDTCQSWLVLYVRAIWTPRKGTKVAQKSADVMNRR